MEQGVRTRLVTALVLVAVFGSGLLLGLAADSSLVATPSEAEEASETPRRSYTFEEVGPSGEQLAEIDVIVEEYRGARRALRDELEEDYAPRHRELVLATRERIKEVLTPEQAADYQARLDQYAAERAERDEDEDDGS